jgi:hypothetical protein
VNETAQTLATTSQSPVPAPRPEEWRSTDYAEYEVSDQGRVRSVDREDARGRFWRGRILYQHADSGVNRYGHRRVSLSLDGKLKTFQVHRLVLEAFVGLRPLGKECRHRDGDPAHNALDNLCWDTPKTNQADRIIHGTKAEGEAHGGAKLTLPQVRCIRQLVGAWPKKYIAQWFGVSRPTISYIASGHIWATA